MDAPTPAPASSPGIKQEHLGKSAKTGPDDLRALILDYLANNCYSGTARAFLKDSAVRQLDADGDEVMNSAGGLVQEPSSSIELSEDNLRLIDLRKDIRDHILSGHVQEATAMLKEHFPTVISDRTRVPASEKSPRPSNTVQYVSGTSVDPSHLSLNLRILGFIEACRTVPIPYDPSHPSSPSSTSIPVPLSSHDPQTAPAAASLLRDDTNLTELVLRAQKLHAAVRALPKATDRVAYLEELKNVSGLLAYPVPERSPMWRYLSQARREAVADQINGAILHQIGVSSVSRLELYARYTTVLWSIMRDLHIKPSSSLGGQRAPSTFDLADFVASS